jgi:hypothetical protein
MLPSFYRINHFIKKEMQMKKLLLFVVSLSLMGLMTADRAQAQEELEISGHANVVSGWQRPMGGRPVSGTEGILNDGLAVPGAASTDTFGFFVDEVEVDLARSFGENIRVRADLDLSAHRADANNSGNATGFVGLEQGYVTFNVPVGNGGEFLIGRFNSGIGLDGADRNDLSTISFNTVHRTLLPHNLTGARFWYGVNDNWSLDFSVVNDLNDSFGTTDMPSLGLDVNWTNGDEGRQTWVRISGAGGPETAAKKRYSFLGDLSANIAAGESFDIGIEGTYRQDNAAAGAADNAQYMAGVLQVGYAFSDIWDGTLRYGFTWDLDGDGAGAGGGSAVGSANPLAANTIAVVGLGIDGTQHDLSLATGYQITDGAKFVLEGRMDLTRPAAGGTGFTPGFAGGFLYSF